MGYPNIAPSYTGSDNHGLTVGETVEANGAKYVFLQLNSGVGGAITSGMLFCSVTNATPYIVEKNYASGGLQSTNQPQGVSVSAPTSGQYFWALTKGYHSALAATSGFILAAGDQFYGATTFSGMYSGSASGTAPIRKPVGSTSVAVTSGVTTFSGAIAIA